MSVITGLNRRDLLVRMGLGISLLALGGRRGLMCAAAASPPGWSINAAAAGTIMIGDMSVNRLGFGAMRLTGDGVWGVPKDPRESRAVLRRAVELGVDFIDTADAYGPYISEQLISEALFPYPRGLVIATKGGMTRSGPDQWAVDGRPAHLRSACEGSLRRLRLERIDLYQLHRPDPKVPLEESIGELARLREQGKIRHVGLSNVTLEQLKRARALEPVVSVQNQYNLADRVFENVLEYCAAEHLAFLPWAPLRGRASHWYNPWESAAEQIAQAHAATSARVAVAWLLAHSKALLPIPGTSSRAHLEDNISAATLHLTATEMQQLG
jgi:pyridoxine 4-dehydrogenase